MTLKHWKNDFRASLVVFLVALPLCLGIALASNAPLASGLLAGMIGGLVVGALSGSHVSVSGPAAGLTVIVAGAVAELNGNFYAFTLSVFLCGIIQILFSALRGGVIGNYFPTSVIKGMLAAIGIILILKQFPHAVGYDADWMGDESFYQPDGQNTFSELFTALNAFHSGAILISLISITIMLLWENLAKKGKALFQLIPGPLIAVIISVVINEVFSLVEVKHLVQLPFAGGMNDFFSVLRLPDWSFLTDKRVYITAMVLAIVASIETLLSIDAADKIDEQGRITSKNRELLAQGLGNMFCGLIGGLPVTAVIVRSSANVNAGSRTKLSAVLHGFWLLICVVSIPFLLNKIPLATLAALLILVGYKLTNIALWKSMYQKGLIQFAPFAITILAILFTDLLKGILIGMLIGFAFVIKSSIHKSIVVVSEGNQFLIRFHKDVSFLQKSQLIKAFSKIPDNSYVIIDGSRGVYVDEDIADLIEDFRRRAGASNITVELKRSTLALSPIFKEVTNG